MIHATLRDNRWSHGGSLELYGPEKPGQSWLGPWVVQASGVLTEPVSNLPGVCRGPANKPPINNREHGRQLNLAPAFRDARLLCLLRTLLLPTFNLNEPVQNALLIRSENRMRLCETRGECLMARHPLHSQELVLQASLHFTACLNPCQHPLHFCKHHDFKPTSHPHTHTHTHTWNIVMPPAKRSTFCKLPSAPGDTPGDGDEEQADSARLLFSLSISNFQVWERRVPDALWCVSCRLRSNCSVGLH